MTEAQYDALAGACDAWLRHPEADLAWLATPSLHVISEHPVHLAQYADLCEALGWDGPRVRRLGQERSRLYRMASLGRRYIAACVARPEPVADVRPRTGRPTVLLLSWLVNASHLSQEDDFYFGPIQRVLAARGLDSLLVLRNQTGAATASLSAAARRPFPCGRLLLPDVAGPRQERRMLRAQIGARRRMTAAGRSDDPPLIAQVAGFVRHRMPSSLLSENLLLHAQVRSLCRSLRPAIVVTLYEGHAWERCVWDAARRERPGVVCAGYQHTILRRRAHAVERLIGGGKRWDPDVVLATGATTAARLRAAPAMADTPVLVLGSHRSGPSSQGPAPTCRGSVLVAPEGLDEECLRLFTFALETARVAPHLRFVLRTHPVFPYARIAARLPGGGALPSNVEVSTAASIEAEFERNEFCLYRGSSVAIYAVLAALQPIYLSVPGEMTIDPLHALDGWRLIVRSPGELAQSAAGALAAGRAARRQEWARAADDCGGYAQPFTPSAVDELLAMTAATGRERPAHTS
jgi:hypothetical protein